MTVPSLEARGSRLGIYLAHPETMVPRRAATICGAPLTVDPSKRD